MKYKKTLLHFGMLLAVATNVLAYHRGGASLPSQGTPVSSWVIIAILAVIVIGVWLLIRWWKKL